MSKARLAMMVRRTGVYLAGFSIVFAWIALMLSGTAGAIAAFIIFLVFMATVFGVIDTMGQS